MVKTIDLPRVRQANLPLDLVLESSAEVLSQFLHLPGECQDAGPLPRNSSLMEDKKMSKTVGPCLNKLDPQPQKLPSHLYRAWVPETPMVGVLTQHGCPWRTPSWPEDVDHDDLRSCEGSCSPKGNQMLDL